MTWLKKVPNGWQTLILVIIEFLLGLLLFFRVNKIFGYTFFIVLFLATIAYLTLITCRVHKQRITDTLNYILALAIWTIAFGQEFLSMHAVFSMALILGGVILIYTLIVRSHYYADAD
ncbi:hypothetical protein [Lapidilactobacillus luobeiensis]|uniref:hypothetical protein n=1 Tax=Lapidilactobacillus luobeiensis TaxID=2950371 RepID=UPI0021C3D236|nr:hypothetical protein [Lapidilactobacillus luobeiensis]